MMEWWGAMSHNFVVGCKFGHCHKRDSDLFNHEQTVLPLFGVLSAGSKTQKRKINQNKRRQQAPREALVIHSSC